MFKEIRDERAFNGILNQIIENIQNGSLKAGDALPAERTMAEIMGVSRPAVREALRALELLGIVKPVPGGGNYITEDLDTWLIEPLSILFKLNNGYLRQNQQFRAALEREAAILAARKCTPLDAAELWVILARLDAAEDEKIRGELDRELHKKIAKIADNPMVYSVLAAVREALRALELLGIVKPVPGGGNYITEDLDTWLIEPLSILFKLNNGYLRQNQQFRAALEREAAILAARKCTPLDAAELWVILARLDAAEDEKIRGELDRELHKKIAKIADNPMVYSVLAAADQLTENIVSGTRDYIMKKNNSVREVDDQHHRLVKAIINGDVEQAERCMSEHMDTIERYMEEMQKKS